MEPVGGVAGRGEATGKRGGAWRGSTVEMGGLGRGRGEGGRAGLGAQGGRHHGEDGRGEAKEGGVGPGKVGRAWGGGAMEEVGRGHEGGGPWRRWPGLGPGRAAPGAVDSARSLPCVPGRGAVTLAAAPRVRGPRALSPALPRLRQNVLGGQEQLRVRVTELEDEVRNLRKINRDLFDFSTRIITRPAK